MVDVANITFTADTSGLTKAADALDDVTKKSGEAEKAASSMDRAYAASARRMGMSLEEYKRHLQGVANAGARISASGRGAAQGAQEAARGISEFGSASNRAGASVGNLAPRVDYLAASLRRLATGGPTIGDAITGIRGLSAMGLGIFGGLSVGAAAYAAALIKAQDEQQKLTDQLNYGLGRFVGLSAQGFRQITDEAALAAGISKRTAQEVGQAFAVTGQVGADTLGDLIVLTRRYADVTGASMQAATRDIAAAFADPAKGAETMARNLGASTDFLSLKTRDLIRTMQANGETTKAQSLLFEELARGPLPKVEKRVENLADAWRRVKDMASNAGDAMVRSLVTTPADRSEELQRSILGLNASPIYNQRRANMQRELAEIYADIDDMDAKALADMKSREAEKVAVLEKAIADRTAAHDLEIQAIHAKTETERAAIAGQQAYRAAIESGLGVQRAKVEQILAEEKALAGLIANINQTIEGYKNQSAGMAAASGVLNAGGGGAAANAAMREQIELSRLSREIDAASGEQKDKLAQKYRELSSAIRESNGELDIYKAAIMKNTMQQEIDMLDVQIKTLNKSTEARYKAIEALKTEQWIQNNLVSTEGIAAYSVRQMSHALVEKQLKLDKAKASADQYTTSLKNMAEAAIGAGSALKTMFASMWSGGGGASGGTFMVGSSAYFNAAGSWDQIRQAEQAKNSQQQSELQRMVSMLERNIDRVTNARQNWNPSAYEEKNPLVFYDPNTGRHFTEFEKQQIAAWEKEIALAEKQLAAIEKMAAALQMSAAEAFKDPFTNKLGPGMSDYQLRMGEGGMVWVHRSLAGVKGFANGGSMMLGGRPGNDNNLLSMNGTPIARVSRGERMDILTPRQQAAQGRGDARPVMQDNRTYNINIRRDGPPPSTQRQWEDSRMEDERMVRRLRVAMRSFDR